MDAPDGEPRCIAFGSVGALGSMIVGLGVYITCVASIAIHAVANLQQQQQHAAHISNINASWSVVHNRCCVCGSCRLKWRVSRAASPWPRRRCGHRRRQLPRGPWELRWASRCVDGCVYIRLSTHKTHSSIRVVDGFASAASAGR